MMITNIKYVALLVLYLGSLYFAFDYGQTTATEEVVLEANESLVKSLEFQFLRAERLTETLVKREQSLKEIEIENKNFEKELANAKSEKSFANWANTALPSNVNGLLNYSH